MNFGIFTLTCSNVGLLMKLECLRAQFKKKNDYLRGVIRKLKTLAHLPIRLKIFIIQLAALGLCLAYWYSINLEYVRC